MRDGLFARFPCEEVYGLHNWPGMPVGWFAAKGGPMMASGDAYEVTVRSTGMHAAQPHRGADAVLTAGLVIVGLQ